MTNGMCGDDFKRRYATWGLVGVEWVCLTGHEWPAYIHIVPPGR